VICKTKILKFLGLFFCIYIKWVFIISMYMLLQLDISCMDYLSDVNLIYIFIIAIDTVLIDLVLCDFRELEILFFVLNFFLIQKSYILYLVDTILVFLLR
jgi:hypothetical protein